MTTQTGPQLKNMQKPEEAGRLGLQWLLGIALLWAILHLTQHRPSLSLPISNTGQGQPG